MGGHVYQAIARRGGTVTASRRRAVIASLGLSVVLLVALSTGLSGSAAAVKWPEAEGRLNAASLGTCASGAPAGGDFGTVWVRRVTGNLVSVKVRILRGVPDSSYTVNVSCQGAIGTLTTDADGEATVRFPPTGLFGLTSATTIVLDVHLTAPPQGSPARATALTLPLL